MDDKLWEPKRRLELQFQKALSEIGNHMHESIDGMADPFDILATVKSLLKNMVFHRYADATAEKMVAGIFSAGKQTWRMAARENSNSRLIYEALRRELEGPVGGSVAFQIQRNAEIIKSFPLDIAKQMTDYISDETIKGRRSAAIAEDLILRFPDVTKNKAKLIARTEVSKTSTALTQARCESIGLDWYRWRSSEDGRVRDSHRLMDGVLVRWTDPPSPERLDGLKNPPAPYHAGNIYNCRCYPEPVVNLDYVKWPAKVFRNGAITMMTRSQFEQAA
ncbi:MAG TPA: phage minor head protein [Desulfosporosinus sp.]|nr:phage minor head protein [Desulfosporosinus sp.]